MKKLKILHKTDTNGGPVSGQHVMQPSASEDDS